MACDLCVRCASFKIYANALLVALWDLIICLRWGKLRSAMVDATAP